MHIRRRLAQFLGALPQWSAIALRDPQEAIVVQLQYGNSIVDVTRNNEIAALVPLTLAIGLDGDVFRSRPLSLSFRDGQRGRLLGTLRLKPAAREIDALAGVTFFDVEGGSHSCLGWAGARADDWLRRHGKSKDPHNFAMTPEAAKWAAIFYICPRPVFLVSVEHRERGNIFPMDQIGRMRSDGQVSLSLRNTNPSVATISQSRRVVLSSVAASRKSNAYGLGSHHRKEHIDPEALPFELETSATFGIRHPANAVRVRELEITDCRVMGSHTFFIGNTVSERRLSEEPQLFHTPGFHQHYRAWRGRPFLPA